MQKLNGETLDIISTNIEKLKEIFPDIFSEGKIDFEALKSNLGEFIDKENERYSFSWNGKEMAKKIALTPSTGTLRPCKADSKEWDSTQNIYIEGDNLEVLKLLQKSYFEKIKMIYIDPPYNTGKDFVYKDNFNDNLKNYMEITGQVGENGERLSTNSDQSGRYHSNWLNMMYPRLKLARNLLKEDGVIFVSIDDNEVTNLKKLCDEIFGEDNFVEQIVWKNKYGAGAKTIGFIGVHEYIFCYSKTPLVGIDSTLNEENVKSYDKKDEKYSVRGGYLTQPLATTSMGDRPNLRYPIYFNGDEIWPDKQWVWSKERLEEAINRNEVVFNKMSDGKYSVRAKQYLKDENGIMRQGKPLSIMNGPFTQEGTKEIKEIFDIALFDFPKPSSLIKYFLSFRINDTENKNDIILDFFSGSATTAHAVMQLNAEDEGNRKFIMVQLPEITDESSEAYKAEYKNICEIGKERIKRAGEKIKEEFIQANANLKLGEEKKEFTTDIGFKVFKLDSSNIKAWDSEYAKNNIQQVLLDAVNNIKEDRTEEDLLFELLIKQGIDLTTPILESRVNDKVIYT